MTALLSGLVLLGPAEWRFHDVHGTAHDPFADENTKALVFVFISPDCPIANSYHPELRRLEEEFAPKGFRYYLIHPDPDVTDEAAKKHAEEYGVTAPVLRDAGQTITKRAGATVTPEAAVIDRSGEVVYLGRIDDLYVDWGKKRQAPTKRELRKALLAIDAGKPVPVAKTKPVGCFIPELPEK